MKEILLLLSLAFPSRPPLPAVIEDGTCKVYRFEKDHLQILAFRGPFLFIYHPSHPLTVRETALGLDVRYVINGSFFENDRENAAHAGWLSLQGLKHADIKAEAQLSHVVRVDPGSGRMTFIDYRKFTPDSSDRYIEFQTGPLVLEENRIAETEIRASINGLREHTRSLLAFDDVGTHYFITVHESLRLDELAARLTALPLFVGRKLSAVNLDGGPSVAFFSRNHPELNYNAEDHLPILLALK
jgi:hypothetical protein